MPLKTYEMSRKRVALSVLTPRRRRQQQKRRRHNDDIQDEDKLLPSIWHCTRLFQGGCCEAPTKKNLDWTAAIKKNYRPVSNLPLLSKVLERLVLKQLLSHLAQNDLNEMFQSAYRKHHSTETAILRVCNDFLEGAEDRKINLLVFLDLSAAFDTIDHNILIKRLECSFGVKGTALKWFASYRTQSVKVSGFQSEKGFLQFGVPQGSVLSPALFTMYTQPLVHIMKKINILYHLYADDTQLYGSVYPNKLHDLINRFEHGIAEVKAWMKVNKLKLNDEKTEVILLGNNNITKYGPSPSLHINDISLEATDKVKNLGSPSIRIFLCPFLSALSVKILMFN